MGINDVDRPRRLKQGANVVRFVGSECDDVAAAKKTSELGLPT